MGRGKTVQEWDDWTDRMRTKHGNGNGHGHGRSLDIEMSRDWYGGFGPYQVAVARWETIRREPSPTPVEPGGNGRHRLNPRFVEWMMGLPPGWVTDGPAPRSQQLKMLGNGVVPQQALLALQLLDPQ
jgi:hypothetical protein